MVQKDSHSWSFLTRIPVLIVLALCGGTLLFPLAGHAEWSGWEGTYPSVGAACHSWVDFEYDSESIPDPPPQLEAILPIITGNDPVTGFICQIRHWIPGAYFLDPTLAQCPSGQEINAWVKSGCQEPIIRKELGECTTCPEQGKLQVGNPIAVANGNKYETVTDFETVGPDPLRWTRFYNSLEN